MRQAFFTERLRVFFAYKRNAPAPFGERLETVYRALKNHGFEVYRDVESIPIGELWRLAIAKAINEADVGIVNWTPGAETSTELVFEADEVLRQGKYCGVLHEDPPKIYAYNGIQSISLKDWSGDLNDEAWRRLITHLERLANERKRGGLGQAAGAGNLDGKNIQERPNFPVLRPVQLPGVFEIGAISPGGGDGGWGWGTAQVTFDRPFAISKHPVSNREWTMAIEAGADLDQLSSDVTAPEQPVTDVSYLQAQSYVAWMNFEIAALHYRLPSEAQWEFARRSGQLEDCSPIVREWTADAYVHTHNGARSDGRARQDPRSRFRTVRGVSFRTAGEEYPHLVRTGYAWDFKSDDVGFRVMREL